MAEREKIFMIIEQLNLFGKSEIISDLPKIPEPVEIITGVSAISDKPGQIFPSDTAIIPLNSAKLGQIDAGPNPHELPAYAEFKQYLTSENPFINCQTTDKISDVWDIEWQKIFERIDVVKDQKSELVKELNQHKGRGKETAILRAPINTQIAELDGWLKELKEREDILQLYQSAVYVRITQKIVDNIFTFEPEFNLDESLESCWEIDDYENYLLSVAIPKVKSL